MNGEAPSLVALRAFIAVGDMASIRGAAQRLGTNHAAVSRHLRNVETCLGIPLVEHRGRGLALTEAGEIYHARLKRAFDDIDAATQDVTAAQKQVFEIHAQPGIAHRLLLPDLPSLKARLPDIDVMIITSNIGPETVPDTIYVELYFDTKPRYRTGYREVVLAAPRMFPVANPRADARWFAVTQPEELMQFPIINAKNAAALWEVWLDRLSVEAALPHSGLQMPNTHLALEAARFGQGIALANDMIVGSDLESGELQEIMQTGVRIEGYRLAIPDRWATSVPVQVLCEWLDAVISLARPAEYDDATD